MSLPLVFQRAGPQLVWRVVTLILPIPLAQKAHKDSWSSIVLRFFSEHSRRNRTAYTCLDKLRSIRIVAKSFLAVFSVRFIVCSVLLKLVLVSDTGAWDPTGPYWSALEVALVRRIGLHFLNVGAAFCSRMLRTIALALSLRVMFSIFSPLKWPRYRWCSGCQDYCNTFSDGLLLYARWLHGIWGIFCEYLPIK